MSNTPPPPILDKRPKTRIGAWLAIALAVSLASIAYIGISFLTLGFFVPVLLIGGILGGIIAFHYFVWGWWLSNVIREASAEDEDL